MDNFNTLSNRLLSRCPNVGILLAQQLVNDSWHQLQGMREWSFRRRSSCFAPPNLYNSGAASTNVASGNPVIITGLNTTWTADMIGRQIRIGGLLYPYYTIVGFNSPTQLVIDKPWFGPDVTNQSYTINQIWFPTPDDFGYMYVIVSVKDGYKLWTSLTEADLAMLDPQRTNSGQTYAAAFYDYTAQSMGVVGPAVNASSPTDPTPISTTSYGYTYPVDATYIIQVTTGGSVGTAQFQWMRAGQTSFTGPVVTTEDAQELANGVMVYWPAGVNYVLGDIIVINCTALVSQAVPRVELWPGPTFNGYLYPYIYIAKEYDLTQQQPNLPPFIANRGEVILEMALQKCAEYPGSNAEDLNIYHDLRQAAYHGAKVRDMLVELERNDEEVSESNVTYQNYPFAPGPWLDGNWEQQHAPFLNG